MLVYIRIHIVKPIGRENSLCLCFRFLIISVDTEDLYPFPIIEVSMPVCERPFKEPVDLLKIQLFCLAQVRYH